MCGCLHNRKVKLQAGKRVREKAQIIKNIQSNKNSYQTKKEIQKQCYENKFEQNDWMLNFSQTYFAETILGKHTHDGLFPGLSLIQRKSHLVFLKKYILAFLLFGLSNIYIFSFFKFRLLSLINTKQNTSL